MTEKNHANLETILNLARYNPDHKELYEPQFLLNEPIPINEISSDHPNKDLFEGIDLHLQESFGDFYPNANEGKAQYVMRIERINRLENGTYDVRIDDSVSSNTIQVQHKRTYHRDAKPIDVDKLKQNQTDIEYSTDLDRVGEVKSIQNLAIVKDDVSTIFSDLKFEFELPNNWKELVQEYNRITTTILPEYREKRHKKIVSKLDAKESLSTIKKDIRKDDESIYNQYKGTIEIVNSTLNKHNAIMNAVAHKIHTTEAEITGQIEYHLTYKGIKIFGLDSDNNILARQRSEPMRKITFSDVQNHSKGLEKLTFNETYQNKFRKELLKKNNDPEYIRDSRVILSESFEQFESYKFNTSIQKAATAFEVALKGFITSETPITKEEINSNTKEYSIKKLLNGHFDFAVQLAHDKNGYNFFNKELKNKLVNNYQPSFTEVRNHITHDNGKEANDMRIALVAVMAYSEAIDIIRDAYYGNIESNSKRDSTSSAMTLFYSDIADKLPSIDKKATKSMIEENFTTVMKYMKKEELEMVKNNSSIGSPAYKQLNRKI